MRAALLRPIAAGLLLSGCVATQRDILDLSQQSDTIALQVHNLKKVTASVQTNAADLNVKLDQLHADLSVLNEQLKDNRESMSALSSKLDDLDAAIGNQVSSLGRSIDSTKNLLVTTEAKRRREDALRRKKEAARRRKDARRLKAEDAARKKAARGPTPSQIYHSARIQLSKKKYSTAVKGFEVYLERWPKGEMADLAAYYLGQAHYGNKKWKDAARNFAFVLDKYPKSPVTPSARLRYAQSLLKLKLHRVEAKRYLESIPLDFPRAPEAEKAKEILRSWDRPPRKPAKKSAKKSGKKKTR